MFYTIVALIFNQLSNTETMSTIYLAILTQYQSATHLWAEILHQYHGWRLTHRISYTTSHFISSCLALFC